jgi:hypothetical protein
MRDVEVVVDPEEALLGLGRPFDREGVVAQELVEDLLGRGPGLPPLTASGGESGALARSAAGHR